jgi:DNA polymerase-3 subunit epsilon
MNVPKHEMDALKLLEASQKYRILRRLDIMQHPGLTGKPITGKTRRVGLCIDTETTGFNFSDDVIIELGIVAFEYDAMTGEISRIVDTYSGFEDPFRPLDPEVTAVTGITDDMLAGQSLDDAAVGKIVSQASLCFCHNCKFDRSFLERRFPEFEKLPFACTMSQIDWKRELVTSRSLEYLLYKCGACFIDAHRALNDAEGLLGLLLENLPVSKLSVFKTVLENARKPSFKIMAYNSAYSAKDLLRDRKYHWEPGGDGKRKTWWTVVSEKDLNNEITFLNNSAYTNGTDDVEIIKIDAFNRFSNRE